MLPVGAERSRRSMAAGLTVPHPLAPGSVVVTSGPKLLTLAFFLRLLKNAVI
jgi:hypothetical protein